MDCEPPLATGQFSTWAVTAKRVASPAVTGWLSVGNRFPVPHDMELIEVRFLVSSAGSGAGYALTVHYSPAYEEGFPSERAHVVHQETGIIPDWGESPWGEVRIPLGERNSNK